MSVVPLLPSAPVVCQVPALQPSVWVCNHDGRAEFFHAAAHRSHIQAVRSGYHFPFIFIIWAAKIADVLPWSNLCFLDQAGWLYTLISLFGVISSSNDVCCWAVLSRLTVSKPE